MATEVASSWYELAQGHEQRDGAYSELVRVLRSTLPDDTEAAAGARVDGQPSVVALAGDGFFLVKLVGHDGDESSQLAVERIPLAPAQPALRIRDGWREDEPAGPLRGMGVQVREWTLTWSGSHVVSFESVLGRSGGFDTGPDAATAFGRALAERLGWALPQ